MSDNTFHVTSEDVRNLEAKEAKYHGGKPPSMAEGGDAAAMKVRDWLPNHTAALVSP